LPEKSQTETTGQAFRNVTLPPSFPGIENAGQADALLGSVRFTFLGGSNGCGRAARPTRRAAARHRMYHGRSAKACLTRANGTGNWFNTYVPNLNQVKKKNQLGEALSFLSAWGIPACRMKAS
jgi:hypothetical protein